MVIAEKFVIGHLGKTGGTTINSYFNQFKHTCIHIDSDFLPKKHQSFSQRESEGINLKDKDFILGIRRLPYWIVSNIFQQYPTAIQDRTLFSKLKEVALEGKLICSKHNKCIKEKIHVDIKTCDELLLFYIDNKEIKHWIRTENLPKDFIRIFSNYFEFDQEMLDYINTAHKNKKNCSREIYDYFTETEISKLYEQSPIWSEIERKIY